MADRASTLGAGGPQGLRRFSSAHYWLDEPGTSAHGRGAHDAHVGGPTSSSIAEGAAAAMRASEQATAAAAAVTAAALSEQDEGGGGTGGPDSDDAASMTGSSGAACGGSSPDLRQALLRHRRHQQQASDGPLGGGARAGGRAEAQRGGVPGSGGAGVVGLLSSLFGGGGGGGSSSSDQQGHERAQQGQEPPRQQRGPGGSGSGSGSSAAQHHHQAIDIEPAGAQLGLDDPHSSLTFTSRAASAPARAAAGGGDAAASGPSSSAPAPAPTAAAGSASRGVLGGHQNSRRKWQAAAQKVVAVKHLTSSFRPGALQGIDVKRHSYNAWFAALQAQCDITVVDYNAQQVEVVSSLTNTMLPEFLKVPRPEWSKVRWINVQGLSWDVITTLAVAFDLHPLSVEDILHLPQRIKADYYPDYVYASVILLSVDHPSQIAAVQQGAPAGSGGAAAHAAHQQQQQQQQQQPPGSRRASAAGSEGGGGGGRPVGAGTAPGMRTRLFGVGGVKTGPWARRGAHGSSSHARLLQPMQPMVEQASLFLFRDGTLLTMFQSVEADSIARQLLGKLEGFRSLLTDSEDASYLFNAVLDAVVDHTLPLVQVYSSRIAALESAVLLEARPRASLTKELHLLSNDLKLLRRTLVPTQHLIHKLQSTHSDRDSSQGFLSPLTVLYLSDVHDHISTVVEDMYSLSEDAKDLIELIFNTIAHNNNASMQMLANVSTIFLPVTFLAGAYGTNFDGWFPEIHWRYGIVYFWVACLLISTAFTIMLKRMGMFETGEAVVAPTTGSSGSSSSDAKGGD